MIYKIACFRKKNEHPRLTIRFQSFIEPQDVQDLKISEIIPIQIIYKKQYSRLLKHYYTIPFPITNPLEKSDPITSLDLNV